MKTQEEWEDQHLQVHKATLVAQKAMKEATSASNKAIKTQKATGEPVKEQQ